MEVRGEGRQAARPHVARASLSRRLSRETMRAQRTNEQTTRAQRRLKSPYASGQASAQSAKMNESVMPHAGLMQRQGCASARQAPREFSVFAQCERPALPACCALLAARVRRERAARACGASVRRE
eukprot:6203051-Pleurochrysis_carterae.AAC.1